MKISANANKYEEYQEELLHYLVKRVKAILEEKEVDETLIYDITGDLVFEVGAIIDGSAEIGTEESPVLPYLAYSKSESEKDNLIVSPIGSCLHEMAYGFVDQVFEEE